MTLTMLSHAQDKPNPKVIPITTQQPEQNKVYPIAIIGAGAAGSMAVKRSVLNHTPTLLFAGAKQERKISRGNWVRTVDNMPGFEKYERTVLELRNETLENLAKGPFRNDLFVIEDSVYSIQKEKKYFVLKDSSGRVYYAQYVVLATGMMDEQPQIKGSIKPVLKYANGQTILYCSLCDGHRSVGKKTVVIGYSETALAVAQSLMQKYPLKSITILTNGHKPQFPLPNNIPVVTNPIYDVIGNKELKQLSGFKLDNGQVVPAEIAFVALGIRPNNSLALQLGAKVDEKGLVVTDGYGETNIPNLFVIGDLRSNSMKQIYTAWQHAVESVQTINQRIRNCK